jgi:hypothetical protein
MDKARSAPARVVSLAKSGEHGFSKQAFERVKVIRGSVSRVMRTPARRSSTSPA